MSFTFEKFGKVWIGYGNYTCDDGQKEFTQTHHSSKREIVQWCTAWERREIENARYRAERLARRREIVAAYIAERSRRSVQLKLDL